LGWATLKADLTAPVGVDAHGYAYRDLEGSKVHEAWREPYGAQYGEGDVIGLLLHMPPGGRRLEASEADVVRFKGALYTMVDSGADAEPRSLRGSGVAFARNGALQGVAFRDVLEGTYYPAASVYTRHSQAEGATVTFNFGPDFKHAPPRVGGWPAPRPLYELAGPPPPAAEGGQGDGGGGGGAAAGGGGLAAANGGIANGA
jgi:Set1/Ash2 histone methyltransferase complex subunit ASH2